MAMFFLLNRVVAHENVDKSDHVTISSKGATRMRADDETEFVPLERWTQEYDYFTKLVKVCPLFNIIFT